MIKPITKARVQRSYEWLLALLVFLVPSNLFFKLFEPTAYVHGLLIDYLIPKLFVSDLVILLILTLWTWELLTVPEWQTRVSAWLKNRQRTFIFLAVVSLLFISRQFFTTNVPASLWYLIKIIEMGCLGLWLLNHRTLFQSPLFIQALTITLLFQAVMGLLQFQTQHSLVGYWFLGETNLNNYIGLAKGVFNGVAKTLPYGTTAHPNILGGVLVIYVLLLLPIKKIWWKEYPVLTGLFLLLVTMTLFLTQSLTAWMTLGIGLLFVFRKSVKYFFSGQKGLLVFLSALVVVPLMLYLTTLTPSNNLSLTRRTNLNQAAVEMITAHPVFGVGLNNFTARVEEYGNFQEVVRFVQPVHHVGLLWLSETGLWGMLMIAGVVFLIPFKSWKSLLLPLIILLPILSLDHYLLTQQSGLLLMVFFAVVYSTTLSGISSEA